MNLEIIAYRISELERLIREHTELDNTNFTSLHKTMTDVRIDITALKTRASLWGAAAGTVAAGVVSAFAAYIFRLL